MLTNFSLQYYTSELRTRLTARKLWRCKQHEAWRSRRQWRWWNTPSLYAGRQVWWGVFENVFRTVVEWGYLFNSYSHNQYHRRCHDEPFWFCVHKAVPSWDRGCHWS